VKITNAKQLDDPAIAVMISERMMEDCKRALRSGYTLWIFRTVTEVTGANWLMDWERAFVCRFFDQLVLEQGGENRPCVLVPPPIPQGGDNVFVRRPGEAELYESLAAARQHNTGIH